MTLFVLILVVAALLTVSYFTIRGGNEQLNDEDDLDDPTITCWDDEKNHTEGGFH